MIDLPEVIEYIRKHFNCSTMQWFDLFKGHHQNYELIYDDLMIPKKITSKKYVFFWPSKMIFYEKRHAF